MEIIDLTDSVFMNICPCPTTMPRYFTYLAKKKHFFIFSDSFSFDRTSNKRSKFPLWVSGSVDQIIMSSKNMETKPRTFSPASSLLSNSCASTANLSYRMP